MPIYEFYCGHCNTIFNFFSKTVNTAKRPDCPRCGRGLERQVSLFSCIERSKREKTIEDLPFDESRLEKGMSKLMAEAERMKEEDPRQAADMMRKFSEMLGVRLGDGMQEALRRIESGEDPEKIEEEMGDLIEDEDPFQLEGAKGGGRKKAPERDETLYDL